MNHELSNAALGFVMFVLFSGLAISLAANLFYAAAAFFGGPVS